MVLKLYDSGDWSTPTHLVPHHRYTLLLYQTEALLDTTLHSESLLVSPSIPPPSVLRHDCPTPDRLLQFGGSNPSGLRGNPPYLCTFYAYGLQPPPIPTLTLTLAGQTLSFTMEPTFDPAGPYSGDENASVYHLRVVYTGGGRRWVTATVLLTPDRNRVRAIDLGGTSILHLQAETPQGYRLMLDRIGTDAVFYLERRDGQPYEAQEVRITAWLD